MLWEFSEKRLITERGGGAGEGEIQTRLPWRGIVWAGFYWKMVEVLDTWLRIIQLENKTQIWGRDTPLFIVRSVFWAEVDAPGKAVPCTPHLKAGWVLQEFLKPAVFQRLSTSQTSVLVLVLSEANGKGFTILKHGFASRLSAVRGRASCLPQEDWSAPWLPGRAGMLGLLSGPVLPNSPRKVQALPQATRTCSNTRGRYKVWPSCCDSSKTFSVI